MRQNFLLRSSFKKISEEYRRVLEEFQREIPKQIREAYESGGQWHDNPGYEAALERQTNTASQLKTLGEFLKFPVFIEDLEISSDSVRIGVEVELSEEDGKIARFEILGPADIKFHPNVMSCYSPLAQQLMSHKVGETIECKLPKGIKKFRIEKISKIDFNPK